MLEEERLRRRDGFMIFQGPSSLLIISFMESNARFHTAIAFLAGILLTLCFKDVYPDLERRFRGHWNKSRQSREDEPASSQDLSKGRRGIVDGIEGCIGNTPLIKIKSLSEYTGCEILAKAEVGESRWIQF